MNAVYELLGILYVVYRDYCTYKKIQEHEILNDIMFEYITYKNLLQILYISIKRSEGDT